VEGTPKSELSNRNSHSFALPQFESETISLPTLFQPKEFAKIIGELKPKLALGGHLIAPKIVINLPNSAFKVISKVLNAIGLDLA